MFQHDYIINIYSMTFVFLNINFCTKKAMNEIKLALKFYLVFNLLKFETDIKALYMEENKSPLN